MEGICDKDGATLIQRDDDSIETVQNRLAVNIEQTKPFLDFYEEKGILVTVDGDQAIDDVFEDIQTKLDKYRYAFCYYVKMKVIVVDE